MNKLLAYTTHAQVIPEKADSVLHILTFGMMTFRNLVFHILENVGLETGLTPAAFMSSA